MEAAKLAVLQKPRPLAQSFFVLALDGVVLETQWYASKCSTGTWHKANGQHQWHPRDRLCPCPSTRCTCPCPGNVASRCERRRCGR